MNDLKFVLQDFIGKANANPKVGKIMKKWNPNIALQSVDTAEDFTMLIRDQKIALLEEGLKESDHFIHIRAENTVLKDVFSGVENPAEMVLEGLMEVFGGDRDQIKLDAITLVIWGM